MKRIIPLDSGYFVNRFNKNQSNSGRNRTQALQFATMFFQF